MIKDLLPSRLLLPSLALLGVSACDLPPGFIGETGKLTSASAEDGGGSDGETTGDAFESTGVVDPTDEPPPPPACLDLIDDLEHGAASLPAINGRQGDWYTYNDRTGVQDPEWWDPFAPALGGYDGSVFAARTSGAGFTEWGAGMGFDFNNAGCASNPFEDCEPGDRGTPMPYDISEYRGISFVGRSNGEFDLNVQVRVPTATLAPIDDGGTCDPEVELCSDYHFAIVTLPPRWVEVPVPFDVFAQGEWGLEADFDLTEALGVQFQIAALTDFDFSIDRVCLY